MILPVGCPLWAIAIAVAFAVILGKEVFGGTGMNIFNVALLARAFLFFSYPTKMSGDAVWVQTDSILGFGNTLPDAYTCATPLGEIAQGGIPSASLMDSILGFIPGSIGETSVVAIAIGAIVPAYRNRRILLRSRVHGYRPRDIGKNRDRKVDIRSAYRSTGSDNQSDEPWISRGNDARNTLRKHDCAYDRLLRGAGKYQQATKKNEQQWLN